jgi:ABC-2 type transport system permease protein
MNSILKVARREFGIIRRKPVYLLGSVGVMAVCCLFYLTFFKAGLPENLPIGVLDLDNSSLSRNFCRQLDATQLGKVIKYEDFTTARDAMQTGEITSLCVIPQGMNEDVNANRRPVFTYYVNSLYLIGGALSYKDILTMVTLTGGAVQREVLRMKGYSEGAIMGLIQPIVIDEHKIGNATTNYGVYLNNIILPGLLALSIIFVLIYALGSELRYGTSRELMETADGSMAAALFGKLLPYTLIYLALGLGLDLLMFGVCHYPLNGSVGNMMLAMVVFILANEAVAVTIIGLLPTLRYALSIAALFTILAFSFSGFTFPVEAMPTAIQGISVLFPLRFYYLLYVQEAIFGTGFAGWWQYLVYMLLFLIGPLCVARRLKGAWLNQNFEK